MFDWLILYFCHWLNPAPVEKFPWLVYYGKQIPELDLNLYNPIVLDPQTEINVHALKVKEKEVLGYLALTEVSPHNEWFTVIKERQLLIKEDPDWPGSWMVDIRNPFWEKLLIEEVIPKILTRGFTGLFYDQLDIAMELEKSDSLRYAGMTQAAIQLVRHIHDKFPHLRFMLNRAYEIIPQVGNHIDYLLAETFLTSYDFKTQQYYLRSQKEIDWQLGQVNQARRVFPHLVAFSVDYWDPQDKKMIKYLYERERAYCLRPYITTINLISVTPE